MSRSLSALRTSLNSFNNSRRRCLQGTRGYAQVLLKSRSDGEHTSTSPRTDTIDGQTRRHSAWGTRQKFGESAQPRPVSKLPVEPHFANHLNALFKPLEFNPEIARRCLTHGSHPTSINGHNAGMTFLGRRVLESYLLLFLNSSQNLKPTHDFNFVTNWTLNTYTLGQHVGSKWGLGRVMRWVPTVNRDKLSGPGDKDALLRSAGLYKVQGDAVAAVIGTIYEQFGGSVAHRAFHTRILPNLLLDGKNGGLPLAFHEEVLKICERMGGVEGDLTEPIGAKIESSP